jgi:HAD superfamily hydrolase (TIGR01549 family)
MIRGIIFDMDGVIIDSNHVHYENWNSVFKKEFSVEIPKEEFGRQLGRSGRHFTEHFISRYGLKSTVDDLKPMIFARFDELQKEIGLKPGCLDTLKMLKPYYKIALATGAGKDWALTLMKRLDVISYFDYIIGGDEVAEAKPHPDIFLKAAEGLKLRPEECIVVEDAELGILAAKKANIHVVSIPDEFTRQQDHSLADGHLKSIKDLPEYVKKMQ